MEKKIYIIWTTFKFIYSSISYFRIIGKMIVIMFACASIGMCGGTGLAKLYKYWRNILLVFVHYENLVYKE